MPMSPEDQAFLKQYGPSPVSYQSIPGWGSMREAALVVFGPDVSPPEETFHSLTEYVWNFLEALSDKMEKIAVQVDKVKAESLKTKAEALSSLSAVKTGGLPPAQAALELVKTYSDVLTRREEIDVLMAQAKHLNTHSELARVYFMNVRSLTPNYEKYVGLYLEQLAESNPQIQAELNCFDERQQLKEEAKKLVAELGINAEDVVVIPMSGPQQKDLPIMSPEVAKRRLH